MGEVSALRRVARVVLEPFLVLAAVLLGLARPRRICASTWAGGGAAAPRGKAVKMRSMPGARSPAERPAVGAALLALLLGATAGAAASPPPAVPGPGWVEYLDGDGQFRWHRQPFMVEFESLLPRLKASAGEPVRQEMGGFGPGWGAGAQVFWRPPAPADAPVRNWPWLRALPEAPGAGRYRVTLVHTVAPDYGTARVFLKGRPVADVDGYGPAVARQRLDLGEFQLGAGPFELLFTVFAKHPKSTAHCVGLDRLELQPVP